MTQTPPTGSTPSPEPAPGSILNEGVFVRPTQPAPAPTSAPPNLKPVSGLDRAALILAAAVTVLHWGLVATHFSSWQARRADPTALTAYDLVGFLTIPLWIASWLVTAAWLARAHRIVDTLRPGRQRLSRVWAWIGWVVPIVSLWFPKQLVDDISATGRELAAERGATIDRPATLGWWISYLVMLIGTQVLDRFYPEGSVIPAVEATQAILLTITLLLWVGVVLSVNDSTDAALGAQRR